MSVESCLAENLSHYMRLQEEDRVHLARFEKEERRIPRQTDLRRVGDENEYLYAVKKGWLYSYLDFADGRRQIVKIHTPGDLIGFPELAYDRVALSLRSCNEATVCPFPKQRIDDVLRASPRLSAVLLTVATRDQVILIDKLRATGRMSARERIAYLLLDLVSRLRIIKGPDFRRMQFPLSQMEIGDTVGLTNVYVSKTMGRLCDEGLIRRHAGGEIEIVEEEELRRIAEFTDRYATLDTAWFS